jgi:hypothetical protein
VPAPAHLWEQSRLYRQAAEEEPTPEIKQRLTSHAHALAQLAESIELRERRNEAVRDARPPVVTKSAR